MKKIIYLTLIAAALCTSCNDWLDVRPRSETPAKDLFKTEQGFRDALTQCYIDMNGDYLYGGSMTMREVEFLAQHWTQTAAGEVARPQWKNFNYSYDAVKTGVGNIYGALYNVIAQANLVLQYLGTNGDAIATDRMRDVIRAEALAVRAYCHTDVLRLFGQRPGGTIKVSLPYAETVSPTTPISYYDFDAFAKKIFDDIDEAQRLLDGNEPLMQPSQEDPGRYYRFDEANADNDFLSYRRFRFNAYALRGMKVRLMLWTGAATTYTEASKLIEDLKSPRQTMELSGMNDIGLGRYGLPGECLMALSNPDTRAINDRLMNPDDLFMLEESLVAELFAGHSTTINNRGQLWDMTSVDSQGRKHRVIKKFRQPATSAISASTTLQRTLQNQVMPLVRLSEIYLIAIETAPSLAESNALYQTYMQARGELVPADNFASREALMAELLNEYRREFFAEGQMFYAYKRLGVANMLWKNDRPVTEQDYIVPLPQSEHKR